MLENVVKHDGEFVYIILIHRLVLYEIYLLLLSPDTGKEWNLLLHWPWFKEKVNLLGCLLSAILFWRVQ